MFSFKGGVHPPEKKGLTAQKRIEHAPIPAKVIIPLSQHTGKPAKPVVHPDEEVKTGQKIAESDGFISLPVHSSISGKVVDICPHPNTIGKDMLSIIIESDGKDEPVEDLNSNREYFCFSDDEIRDIIRDAGVAGLGGAAFPTHVKLTPPEYSEIDTVIINGCECEPYLTCDHRLMLEYSHGIIEGLKIIMRLVHADRGIIAVENNKMDAIETLTREIKRKPNVELAVVKARYPQGAEKQLINAVLGRVVPAGKLPLDAGVIVSNVGTAVAIKDAVIKNRPLIDRVVTVTGTGIKDPKNLLVRIGTKFRDVIDFCGGLSGEPGKIIAGGPMMGIAQYTLDVPVVKGTSGILVLNDPEVFTEEYNCIRCGRCVDICPTCLFPYAIYRNVRHKKWDAIKKYNVFDCMECGACAYVCPARLNLVQSVKIAKNHTSRENK